MSDTDLAFRFHNHEDQDVRELLRRFEGALEDRDGTIESLEEELEERYSEIGELQDEIKEYDVLERDIGNLENEIEKLEEQLAHEHNRTREFYNENQQFIAEIKHLKTANANQIEKEGIMLEQQIEKLTERVGAVEEQQSRTNELLGEILIVLRDGGANSPEPVQAAKAVKSTPKKTKKPKPEIVPEAEAEPEHEYTLDDVRTAFIDAKERDGKDRALRIVEDVAGEVKNITKVPVEKYAELVTALQSQDLQEAV
jgi:predicted RNase H-like nuclease (RuvC/YqgF family)